MVIIIIFCLWISVSAGDSDSSYIPSDWVDPRDMRNYNRQTKSMKSPTAQVAGTKDEVIDNSTTSRYLNDEVERFQIFLQRFINRVLLTADLKNKIIKPQTRITTEIPVLITTEELSRLIALGEHVTSSELTELDNLFSSIFNHERGYSFDVLTPYLNPVEQLFHNMTWEKLTVTVVTVVFGVVLWMFAVGKSLKRIMIFLYLIFFMGGLAGNWWHMYQDAVAEHFAEVKKFSHIPDVCAPKKVSIFSFLFSSVEDECKQYHKAFQVDPFSKIPPSIVLSETLSMMLIHPLKSLGSALGDFLKGINGAAPWPLSIVFLPFVYLTSLVFVFFFFVVWCGIKLNFWTLFGGINIGGRTSGESNYPKINDVADLQNMLEHENEQEYIVIRARTVKQYLNNVRTIDDQLMFTKHGEGDNSLRYRPVYCRDNSTASCSATEGLSGTAVLGPVPIVSHAETNAMLQLMKHVPKHRYFGKSLSHKSRISKKYK